MKILELQPYVRSLQDLVSFPLIGEEVAMRIYTIIDVIMQKKKVAFKTLSQMEQFTKQRCSPSFQPIAQSAVEPPQKEPDVQEVLQQSPSATESANNNDWKKNDNSEFRLSSLNKMLDMLARFETSIYNESTSRSEYVERLRELQSGCNIIFEQQEDQYSCQED
jgi:hypothetical protein